jgi:hypothetical protein
MTIEAPLKTVEFVDLPAVSPAAVALAAGQVAVAALMAAVVTGLQD